MLKKAKLYSLLALIVASTVVGLVLPSMPALAQTDTGSTMPALYIDPSIEDDVNAKILREAMLLCLSRNNDTTDGLSYNRGYFVVSGADLANGKWFRDMEHPQPAVGYSTDGEDGKYWCNEGDNGTMMVSAFLKAYPNLGTPFQAACALGFKPISLGGVEADEEKCLSSDGKEETGYRLYTTGGGKDDTELEKARKKIDGSRTWSKAAGSGGIGENTPVQNYVLYMRTFQLACNPSNPIAEPDINENDGTKSTHKSVAIVDGHGKPTNVYFIVPDLTTDKKIIVQSISGNSNENKNCQELIDAINASAPAYADYVEFLGLTDAQIAAGSHNLLSTETPGGSGADSSTCRVDGIGWIICPVVNLMARMVDDSYYLLDNNLLRTPAISLETTGPLYKAWSMMRNFANVAFVIAFMIIIFSQITSYGIGNYGIKQLLPKLIIAAILVNLSYIICAAAVDVSNLLGSELKDSFDKLASDIDTGTSSGPFGIESASDGSGKAGIVGWAAIAGSILIAASLGGGILAVLALLIPFLFAALGAVIATVLTLIIRQALIIILIFIAPLAFVALLLPNTEEYFKKWRKLFQSLLLLYPVIALVFGGSALASRIIMAAAESSSGGDPLGDGLGGMTQTLLQLSGAVVSVVPLFLVPMVIKVAGGALNRFAGIVNNPNKGPIDALRNRSMKGVERMQKNEASSAFETGRRSGVRGRARDFVSGRSKYHRDADMKREDTDRDRELAFQESNYGVNRVKEDFDVNTASARQIREMGGALRTQDSLKSNELAAANLVLDEENVNGKDMQRLATIGYLQDPKLDANGNVQYNANGEVVMGEKRLDSDILQLAAAVRQFTEGSTENKLDIIKETVKDGSLEKYSREVSKTAAQTNLGAIVPQVNGKGYEDIAQNKFDFEERTYEAAKEGRFSSEAVAGMNEYAMGETRKVVETGAASTDPAVSTRAKDTQSILQEASEGIYDSESLKSKVAGNPVKTKHVTAMRNYGTATAPTQESSQPAAAPTGAPSPANSNPASSPVASPTSVPSGPPASTPSASQTGPSQPPSSSPSLFEATSSDSASAELAKMSKGIDKLAQQLQSEGSSYALGDQDRLVIRNEVMQSLEDWKVEQPSPQSPPVQPPQSPRNNVPRDIRPDDV